MNPKELIHPKVLHGRGGDDACVCCGHGFDAVEAVSLAGANSSHTKHLELHVAAAVTFVHTDRSLGIAQQFFVPL